MKNFFKKFKKTPPVQLPEAPMTPVLVKAFGRTGTTLMMQLLGSGEEIFVPGGYPFESRYLSYFSRLASISFDKREHYPEGYHWNDLELFQNNFSLVGSIPYDVANLAKPDLFYPKALNALWDAFSTSVGAQMEVKPRFYAEKVSWGEFASLRKSFKEHKVVYLVRDPRDELSSIMSFNKKINAKNGFGWQDGDTDFTFAQRMLESRKRYFNEVHQYQLDPNSQVAIFRYEDMVTDLVSVQQQLEQFLGCPLDASQALDSTKSFSKHMTNKTASQSIGSWKEKISPEASQVILDQMAAELAYFSYE